MITKFIESNGIQLFTVQHGRKDGPLVIMLHGFPEFWYGWHRQVDALTEAGYSVWTPDMRGYNLSEKPKGTEAYALDELAKDVAGLIEASGHEKAILIGHDWGAAVAWWVANKYPDKLAKLVILNVPHPSVMVKALNEDWAQRRRSWYMFYFQIPMLPEMGMRFGNWRYMAQSVQDSARPNTFTETDMAQYRKAWGQPGAITAMLNYYRAIFRHRPAPLANPRVQTPTLIIWGAQDAFIGREYAEKSLEMCDNGKLVMIEEATHWVQHEEPERVNELILEFLEQ
ncbi:MAG: alpha/beta hydrolase [Caldilineaceae bacterium]